MKDIFDIFAKLFPNVSPDDAVLFFMLIFTRWLMMSITMPFLGGQLLPNTVRIGLAALLSVVCFVTLIDQQAFYDINIVFIVLLFLKEGLIGFLFGFFASIIFYAYELVGEFLDISRGASMSRLLVPEVRHQSSAMGVLLFQLSLVVFIGLGFHRDVIAIAYESFINFPVLKLESVFKNANFLFYCVNLLAVLVATAIRFALPVVAVSLLIDFAFGLLNRVAPQINAYFLSLPAKMLSGLVMVFLVIPFIIDDFAKHYQDLSRFFSLTIK